MQQQHQVLSRSSSSLQAYNPLCFSREVFTGDAFKVDAFITDCRKRVPLESVQKDLREYAKHLDAELVELINKEYHSFFSLSSSLVGIDVVLSEFNDTLASIKGEISIFATGIPDLFFKTYNQTSTFISSLEDMYTTPEQVIELRASSSHHTLLKRWNFAIYFQLCLSEVASGFEKHLSTPLIDVLSITNSSFRDYTEFYLQTTKHLTTSLDQCWSNKMFIYELSGKFFKLFLQLIARYEYYIQDAVSLVEAGQITQPSTKLNLCYVFSDIYNLAQKPPTKPSPYVTAVVDPFETYLTNKAVSIPPIHKNEWVNTVFVPVTERFLFISKDLLDTVTKANEYLNKLATKKKQATDASNNSGASAMTDIEKMSLQLYLDVVKFGALLQRNGIDLPTFEPYTNLFNLCFGDSVLKKGTTLTIQSEEKTFFLCENNGMNITAEQGGVTVSLHNIVLIAPMRGANLGFGLSLDSFGLYINNGTTKVISTTFNAQKQCIGKVSGSISFTDSIFSSNKGPLYFDHGGCQLTFTRCNFHLNDGSIAILSRDKRVTGKAPIIRESTFEKNSLYVIQTQVPIVMINNTLLDNFDMSSGAIYFNNIGNNTIVYLKNEDECTTGVTFVSSGGGIQCAKVQGTCKSGYATLDSQAMVTSFADCINLRILYSDNNITVNIDPINNYILDCFGYYELFDNMSLTIRSSSVWAPCGGVNVTLSNISITGPDASYGLRLRSEFRNATLTINNCEVNNWIYGMMIYGFNTTVSQSLILWSD
eukprot:gene15282-18091_t